MSNKNWLIIFKGIIISCILTVIAILIFSIILTYTNVSEDTIFPVLVFITAISILIGSSISTIKLSKNGIINGAIIGLTYIVSLYLISGIFGAGFILNLNSIILILSCMVTGMIGGIVGVNIK